VVFGRGFSELPDLVFLQSVLSLDNREPLVEFPERSFGVGVGEDINLPGDQVEPGVLRKDA
jgi:hypothetical protein